MDIDSELFEDDWVSISNESQTSSDTNSLHSNSSSTSESDEYEDTIELSGLGKYPQPHMFLSTCF